MRTHAMGEMTVKEIREYLKNNKAKKEIISIIDTTSVKLHGVIPYDPELISAGNQGILIDEMLSFNVTNAFDNLAARTLGEGRRLFAGIKRLRKLK